jgi:hypothetical protein
LQPHGDDLDRLRGPHADLGDQAAGVEVGLRHGAAVAAHLEGLRRVGAGKRAFVPVAEQQVFETNGTQTWARLRRSLEDLLLGYWHEGAFAGANAAQAFQVRCDRSTMTQADLDAGRLIAEISVRPAQAIEVITVRLQLGNALGSTGLREAA